MLKCLASYQDATLVFRVKNDLGVHTMTVENGVRIVAGSMVLVSVLLAALISPWWLILTAFIGLNLIQSAVTGFCPAEMVLRRCGLKSGC